MKIRPIHADEGARLRALRLRALADAPDAFGTTLAEAEAWPDTTWHELAQRRATGAGEICFLVEAGDGWFGMVAGVLDDERPEVATLISMWVDPVMRGRGVGRGLVEAVVSWARRRGVRSLELWVTESNAPAIALYTSAGFAPTGAIQPHPSNPALGEAMMRRPLSQSESGYAAPLG